MPFSDQKCDDYETTYRAEKDAISHTVITAKERVRVASKNWEDTKQG